MFVQKIDFDSIKKLAFEKLATLNQVHLAAHWDRAELTPNCLALVFECFELRLLMGQVCRTSWMLINSKQDLVVMKLPGFLNWSLIR